MDCTNRVSYWSLPTGGTSAAKVLRIAAFALLLAAAAGLAELKQKVTQPEQRGALHGEAAVQQLKTDGGYASLASAVAAARYQITAAPAQATESVESGAQFYANNPAQHLRATFASDEVQVGITSGKPDDTPDNRQLRLHVAGYGYQEPLEPLAAGVFTASGNRIETRKSAISDPQRTITEWYVNKPEGLEQGFTLTAPPPGQKAGGSLRVALTLGEGWLARVNNDQKGALLERQADGLQLSYQELVAFDVEGHPVPARMSFEPGFDGGTLTIQVDDAEAVYPLTIDPILTQQRKLIASDGEAGDELGWAVALSGNTAVVAAPLDDAAQGSAYVFVRNGTSWSQEQRITASDGGRNDRFGSAVAVSGDTLIVSAQLDSIGANTEQGSAYVFTRTGSVWTQQQKLTASDGAAHDFFGGSVALSGDTLVVGAVADDVDGTVDQGSAYVFVRSGGVWMQQQRLVANDGSFDDLFGFSVALSGDTVVVGAFADDVGTASNQGSAYVFTRNGTAWTQQTKVTAADGAPADFFGFSVSISGDTVVVGSPFAAVTGNVVGGAAYVFTRSGGLWTAQQKLKVVDHPNIDRFGFSVALSGDTLVVGAEGDDIETKVDQGSAYVFTRAGAVWTQQQRLTASDGATHDFFGKSVALSGDTVLVGAPSENIAPGGPGAGYVFVIRANNHLEQQQLTANDGEASDGFGISVALSGDTVVVGAEGDDVGQNVEQGSAYVFTRSGSVWTLQQRLIASDGAASDVFGISVAMSGNTVVIGADGDTIGANVAQGSAYVFTRSGETWTQQQKLIAEDGKANDFLGRSVTVSGNTVAVGAHGAMIGANVAQGAAYVFTRSGAVWTQQQKLTANDGAAVDRFGTSIALSGDTLVAGAFEDDVAANANQGSAYVFSRSGTVWTQQQKLTASDGSAQDIFGFSVSLDGDTVVVGAPLKVNSVNGSQGSAYVFTRTRESWTQRKRVTGDVTTSRLFGFSVALDDQLMVIGAESDTIGEKLEQGSAYVFARRGVDWMLQQRLTVGDGAAGDGFGSAVSLNGDTVVVGAPLKDLGAKIDQGSVYIFVLSACPAITLSRDVLPGAAIGNPYSHKVTAGGNGPFQFSLSDGALPPGLSLTQDGLLSGTPTAAGSYAFTISATALSSICSGSGSYILTVTGTCPTIILNPTRLPDGVVSTDYDQTITASGGTPPYTFTLSEGNLPVGLSLTATGALRGKSDVAGTSRFVVRVTDVNGCQGTRAYSVTIDSSACSFAVAPANFALPSDGGDGVVNVNAAEGCLWTASSDDPMITITSAAGGSGNGTVSFHVSNNPTAGSRRGLLTIAGRKVTVVQAPLATCVSAASFARDALASESIVAAFGSGLAESTEVAATQPLPKTLGGVRVSVIDSMGVERFASIFFVSPTQINFQVPPGTASGRALVTIIHNDETVAADSPQIELVSPGLFSANANGQGPVMGLALHVKADDSQSFEPIVRFDEEKQQFVTVPVDLSDVNDHVFLVLFGTGLRNRSSLDEVSLEIGGVKVEVTYAGEQGVFVGLDQVNVLLPRSLVGIGEVELRVLVAGQEANKVRVAIK